MPSIVRVRFWKSSNATGTALTTAVSSMATVTGAARLMSTECTRQKVGMGAQAARQLLLTGCPTHPDFGYVNAERIHPLSNEPCAGMVMLKNLHLLLLRGEERSSCVDPLTGKSIMDN